MALNHLGQRGVWRFSRHGLTGGFGAMRNTLRRSALVIACAAIGIAACLSTLEAQQASTGSPPSARTWLGRSPAIESHLKTARVVRLEDIGTGVTHPQRAYLEPNVPVDSLVWKVLPPGRRHGHWESYKSEIAAYELDKLLGMNMVPPAVERTMDGEVGAAVMWLESIRSVKQLGGAMPAGAIWGHALRKMMMFDNLIANPDRNAGNILVGPPGELILIDHSRAFIDSENLIHKIERVDAGLWDRMEALTRPDLTRVLEPWIDEDAIGAMMERRDRMVSDVNKLVAKRGRAAVIIP